MSFSMIYGRCRKKKVEEKRHDVLAVYIGVRHDDDAVVAEFFRPETVRYSHPEGDDERLELFKLDDFVQARAFGIENFPRSGRIA